MRGGWAREGVEVRGWVVGEGGNNRRGMSIPIEFVFPTHTRKVIFLVFKEFVFIKKF